MTLMTAQEWEKNNWKAMDVFLHKYERKESMVAKDNERNPKQQRVTFVYDKKMAKLAAAKEVKKLDKILLKDTRGNTWKITQLFKIHEFGGKDPARFTQRENIALDQLKKQIDAAKKEEGTSTIKVRIDSTIYEVYDTMSTDSAGRWAPKSDFHLVDFDGNEIAWISHKAGKYPRDFQQWGGMGESSERDVFNHAETQKWLRDLTTLYPNGIAPGPTLFRFIKDPKLKMLSVYGNEYGRRNSRQNVNLVLQGDIVLKKLGGYYQITAFKTHVNGDSFDGTDYEPVFTARFASGRRFVTLPNTRALIMPEGTQKMAQLPPLPG